MGLLDFLFGANLTSMDARTIAHGVEMGINNAELSRILYHEHLREAAEKHNRKISPVISAAREYEKSFLLVNNEINRSYGYLPFNPMMAPQRMNDEQRQKAYETIENLTASGRIPPAHAERMTKYLNDMLGKEPSP